MKALNLRAAYQLLPSWTESYLLQAEEKFSQLDFEAAELLYDAAISSSIEHKLLNEEALSNELAGHFFNETGRKMKSKLYFSRAFQKYSEWGAVAKAATLGQYM